MSTTYAIRVGTTTSLDPRFREADVKYVKTDTVGQLNDAELLNGVFYAEIEGDAEKLLMLRRESMRRAVLHRDDAAAQEIISKMTFELVASLFCNADHQTRLYDHVTGYDENGEGIVLEVPRVVFESDC